MVVGITQPNSTPFNANNHFGVMVHSHFTEERWQHIIEDINHPEMFTYEDHLRDVIKTGKRKQDTLNPQKYRYSKEFDDLLAYNTHIVAIVLFRFSEDAHGRPEANNYIVTAYMKELGY